MKVVLDNDIIFKGATYGLLSQFVLAECSDGGVVGILGAARFVVASKIRKRTDQTKREIALKNLKGFLTSAVILEPSEVEESMAADLELAAQKTGLALDSGESQLCAIVVSRVLSRMLTGDKRAIEAIEKLIDCDSRLEGIQGKIECLEQLITKLLLLFDAVELRRSICEEPAIDKALSNCFSCNSPEVKSSSFVEGLNSYVEALRINAMRALSA